METSYPLGKSSASKASDYSIEKRIRQVLRYLSLEGCAILDVGCGNGLCTLEFAEVASKTVGVEIQEKIIEEAVRNRDGLTGHAEFVIACAEHLPFGGQLFDVVLSIEMLEHVADQQKVLEEANRVLRKDGHLVIYVPNKLYPFEVHGCRIGNRMVQGFHGSIPLLSWAPQSIRRRFERARIYSEKEIVCLIEKHGFVVENVDYMYPPLDKLGGKFVKTSLRRAFAYLEHNHFLKRFGISILVLAQKR